MARADDGKPSDRKGAFAEVLQAMTFERREAQAQAS